MGEKLVLIGDEDNSGGNVFTAFFIKFAWGNQNTYVLWEEGKPMQILSGNPADGFEIVQTSIQCPSRRDYETAFKQGGVGEMFFVALANED